MNDVIQNKVGCKKSPHLNIKLRELLVYFHTDITELFIWRDMLHEIQIISHHWILTFIVCKSLQA